jgi:regulator of replication initiation timing
MPMEREAYQNLLSELLLPDLEHSRRTDILTEIQNEYNGTTTEYEELKAKQEKLLRDNNELILANSKLFRLQGITEDTKEKEKEKEKEFSETVTLEALENRR